MKPSISVIVPAFNEEKIIGMTIETILSALKGRCFDYELLVFDDCSSDATGNIADTASDHNGRIKVVHNRKNWGFGYNYRTGVSMAKFEYISMIPGDNEISFDSICALFDSLGSADIIIPYTLNSRIRPLARRFISRAFTSTLNFLFGLKLKYYNGPVIHQKTLIRSVRLSTDSFAFQAEALIKLLKKHATYQEVGILLNKKPGGVSKAFRFNNICGVLATVIRLWYEIVICKRIESYDTA